MSKQWYVQQSTAEQLYEQLPADQRLKDHVFQAVVHAFTDHDQEDDSIVAEKSEAALPL